MSKALALPDEKVNLTTDEAWLATLLI
jgi:hypothetical protein